MAWMQKRIIGLDIDEGSVIATEISLRMNKIFIVRHVAAPSLEELVKDPSFRQSPVFIYLPSQIVLLRTFQPSLALLKSRTMSKDVVTFLQHQSLPFKLNECWWDVFILENSLNLVAARKETVAKYIVQVEELGLRCCGVTTLEVALYNVFIQNYPEMKKNRFAILNIRKTSSDLLVYEVKRLWIYPIAIGKLYLEEGPGAAERFAAEVHSVFTAHYLRNPVVAVRAPSFFYLSGQGCCEALISALKNTLSDFEVRAMEPLKNMRLSGGKIDNPAAATLSLGLGLTYLGSHSSLKINLIKDKVKKENIFAGVGRLKKAAFSFAVALAAYLIFMDIYLFRDFRRQEAAYKYAQGQVSLMLPQLKQIKAQKERLQGLYAYLEGRLNHQMLYLKLLAVIADNKASSVEIKEFEVDSKDNRMKVFLSGSAPAYKQINDFLTNLKRNPGIKELKLVASTFSASQGEGEAIGFRLGFEIDS